MFHMFTMKNVVKPALLACLLACPMSTMADSTNPAEDYQFVSNDGAWCWFSDPRAIYVNNHVIGGYVDDEGSIWAFSYDPSTQKRINVKVHDKLNYDDHANPSVMQLKDGRIAIFYFLDMYAKTGNEAMFLPTLARTEWVVEHEPAANIDNTIGRSDRWWWCDALYMAPPVYTRMYALTGEKKYLKFFDKEFKACYDQLYDKEENLFFRDSKFLDKKEANGKKVFWGRGNGWVIGGFAEILKTLPAKEKKYRAFYEDLFKEMAASLILCQDKNGYWHASLLDLETYIDPETSSTGLITYALAYGINNGLLDENTYKPIVVKAWKALVNAVDTEGKVCWVQPVGHSPKHIDKKSTDVYGVGGFLMTAVEMLKMIDN